MLEYPMGAKHGKKCPTARYVAGTSVYLCQCANKSQCAGWQAATAEGWKPYKVRR